MTTDLSKSAAARPRVVWRAVGLFVLLAYAGAWLALLPLLLSGFHRTQATADMTLFIQVSIAVTMLTPAVAGLIVLRWVHRPESIRVAIGLAWPCPIVRFIRDGLFALAVPLLLELASLGIATLVGTYYPDLARLTPANLAAWAGVQLIYLIIWLPMFFGEELGWQGYLLPRLAPLGSARALILTAVIFALWHLPTLAMGGQYPGHSLMTSIGAFLVTTALILPIFAWLRMRSDSVWPAVLAHSTASGASTSLTFLLSDPDTPIDPLQVGMTSWTGWIVMGTVVAVLAATGRLNVSRLVQPVGRHSR
ncbi:CPBP family intramembrane metalloprotease [Nocardia sp. CDC159]|uniref:CPBP family intramembrane metalloprotease n=1 Tax=Nocardia pulmonis TaxID=2951408 RepID=A0A9X2EEH4_9NOCA|nr:MULTISPECIES: CPBP family intramembrane glutamic endopeptidase [Nocardia]MCM6778984.1 CPBP family intramembrane metalloprotease [Nocardia pulmonis]MCM6791877.1 CPBP family intramembrane metalloprotease [Nocardia sp. CDC159]